MGINQNKDKQSRKPSYSNTVKSEETEPITLHEHKYDDDEKQTVYTPNAKTMQGTAAKLSNQKYKTTQVSVHNSIKALVQSIGETTESNHKPSTLAPPLAINPWQRRQ